MLQLVGRALMNQRNTHKPQNRTERAQCWMMQCCHLVPTEGSWRSDGDARHGNSSHDILYFSKVSWGGGSDSVTQTVGTHVYTDWPPHTHTQTLLCLSVHHPQLNPQHRSCDPDLPALFLHDITCMKRPDCEDASELTPRLCLSVQQCWALVGGTDEEFVADNGATITSLIGCEISTCSRLKPETHPSHHPLNMVTWHITEINRPWRLALTR